MKQIKAIMPFFIAVFIVACDSTTENTFPVISSIEAESKNVVVGEEISLTCIAADADGDEISYIWEYTRYFGSVNGSGSTVSWTAPGQPMSTSVTCWVFDGQGGADKATIYIMVGQVEENYEESFPEEEVLYYPFDGNYFEHSGNGLHAQRRSMALDYDRFGNASHSAYFNAVSSYMEIPDHALLDVTGEISISVWLNPHNVYVSNVGSIILKQVSDTHMSPYATYGLFLFNNPGVYQFRVGGQSLEFGTIEYGVWQHVVVAYDATAALTSCWINGELVSRSSSWSQDIGVSDYPLLFGMNPDNDEHYTGNMDAIRIFDYTLTEGEVKSLYHEGN